MTRSSMHYGLFFAALTSLGIACAGCTLKSPSRNQNGPRPTGYFAPDEKTYDQKLGLSGGAISKPELTLQSQGHNPTQSAGRVPPTSLDQDPSGVSSPSGAGCVDPDASPNPAR